MTAINLLWGPGSMPGNTGRATTTIIGDYALDDADDSVAFIFSLPKAGTVTHIGFCVGSTTGTPPDYYAGLVTVDAAGLPTTTPYGGSAIATYSPVSTGWVWVELPTPATAVAGDIVAIWVYPTDAPPDAANHVDICNAGVMSGHKLPRAGTFTTAWSISSSIAPHGIKYTSDVYGMAVTAFADVSYDVADTPDEVGNLFVLPADMLCSGCTFQLSNVGANASMEMILYNAANDVLTSVVVDDEDKLRGYGNRVNLYWTPVQLAAATSYRLVLKATHATAIVRPAGLVFESTGAKANGLPEGTNWQKTQRTDAGAWSETALAVMHMALWISEITFANGGGAGGAYGAVS